MTIDLFRPFLAPDVNEHVSKVLSYDDNGRAYIGEGEKVELLEKEFQELCNFPYLPLAVNSGTTALEVALFLAGIKPGDKVIVSPITCSATVAAILTHYAIPVWADVDKDTGLIDVHSVERNVYRHPDTKAIVAINWSGLMPDYKTLRSFGLPVIEDAAHGPYWTKQVRGNYVAFSMQAIKFLTTGDGGMLFTPETQYDQARLYRWFGLDRKSSADFRCAQNIKIAGRKLHLNDISAAIGIANIKYTEELVKTQQKNAKYYYDNLKDTKRVSILPYYEQSAYWIYTVHVDNPFIFTQFMRQRGIAVSPVHRRCDTHDAYNFPNGDLPGTEMFDSYQINLPVGWWLTKEDLDTVIDAVHTYEKVG